MLLARRLQLVTCCDINPRRKFIHQLPIPNLFEVAAGGDIQMSIKEPNLLNDFIKILSILLDCFPFKVISILDLGLEHFLQLSHLCSVEVLVLLEFLF